MSRFVMGFGALCALALGLSGGLPARADEVGDATLHAAVIAEQARAPAPRFERRAFLVRPSITSPALSPDGRGVAYLRQQGHQRSVWLLPTSGGAPRQLLGQTDAGQLDWSHDGRWLLLQSARQVFALASSGQGGSGMVATLGGPQHREFAAIDPVYPAAIVMSERTPTTLRSAPHWRLVRVDVHGRRTTLREDARRLSGFAFQADGRLAFVQRVEGEDLVIHQVDERGSLHELARCRALARCSLLPLTDPAGRLLLRSDIGGSLDRLLVMAPTGVPQTLHVDPAGVADLDELTLDPINGQPLIAAYRSTVPASFGLTADAQRQVATIARQLPGRDLSIAVGRGADARWLIGTGASWQQGKRWYLYDPRTGVLRDVLTEPPAFDRDARATPWLPASAMARKIPFAYTASDGMRLHGFVSLPPGAAAASVPLVSFVHGGPWGRARPEFNAYVQLLVNRGYAVFEPNFRGSTGFGRDYVFAAKGDFGNGRVQQDIVEGTHYLLAQGVGDARRVGIVGASFGGYSTLLGVIFSPELFKVGVAIVPPPDFAWDLRWIGRSSEALNLSRYIPYHAWLRISSLDLHDATTMTRLHAQSPLAHAAALQRPLLLVAGGEDHRVAIRGVLAYAATLRLLGKDVSLLVDPQAGHSSQQPLAREAVAYLLERMLSAHLGGLAPARPDAALSGYLTRMMKFSGHAMRVP